MRARPFLSSSVWNVWPDAASGPDSRPLGRLLLVVVLLAAGCATKSTAPQDRVHQLGGQINREHDHQVVILTGWKGEERDYALVAQLGPVGKLVAARSGEAMAPVTNATLTSWQPFRETLSELDLDGMPIDDAGAKTLATWKGLVTLRLQRTAVTDDGLVQLGSLPNLKHLYLKGSRVTEEAAKKWREEHPHCNLHPL